MMTIPNSFLLDEVRCGFMIPAAVKQAWAAELEVLMEIDRVCKKHNITYFADWGTLLGTVRHGGFVPWDDDLDIVMKREDYQKFMTVARFDMEKGFHVQTYKNQKDFWLFMGKVVGKNHFCFEKEHLRRFHNFPYIACVDIFVLDYVHQDREIEEKKKILCKYMLGVADAIVESRLEDSEIEKSVAIIKEMWSDYFVASCGNSVEFEVGWNEAITDPVNMGRWLYEKVEFVFASVSEQEGDVVTQMFPYGLSGESHYYPKEYYEKVMELPFECTTMPVPLLYDKMLRMRYGEYMRPVKDGGGHDYPFFEGQKANLLKVLDFDYPEFRYEPEMLCRSEEEKACKAMSYKEMTKECVSQLWHMAGEIWRGILGIQANAEKSNSNESDELSISVVNLLQDSQQLAIDWGTMLEQVLGEDCKLIHLLEDYCEVLYAIYEEVECY